MTLQDIRKVIHLTDYNEVTRHLENGWVIINTYTVHSGNLDHKDEYDLVYSIGAPADVDFPPKKVNSAKSEPVEVIFNEF